MIGYKFIDPQLLDGQCYFARTNFDLLNIYGLVNGILTSYG